MENERSWETLFDIYEEKMISCGQAVTIETKKISLQDKVSYRTPQDGRDIPLTVCSTDGGEHYEILTGEKQLNGTVTVTATVTAVAVPGGTAITFGKALFAEISAQTYDPYTEALIFCRLIREFLLTAEDVAVATGRTKNAVCTSLRLTELPQDVIAMLQRGELGTGHCRALLNLRNKTQIFPLAKKAVNRHLSVRETGRAVKAANAQYDFSTPDLNFGTVPENFSVSEDSVYKTLEQSACTKLGRQLKIQAGKRRNILTLEFYDEQDLRFLLATLCGEEIE